MAPLATSAPISNPPPSSSHTISPPLFFASNRHHLGFQSTKALVSIGTQHSRSISSMLDLNVNRHFQSFAPPPVTISQAVMAAPALPPSQPKVLKSYAAAVGKTDESAIFQTNEEMQVDVRCLSTPCIKGQEIVITLNEDVYQKSLAECKSNLLGRIIFNSKIPTPMNEIYNQMKQAFAPADGWRMVPLGKGYFDLHFTSVVEKQQIQDRYVWSLPCGSFRTLPWQPDFNPAVPKSTHAQVWIRISYIGQEYWHPHLIMEIANGVGNPLQIDVSTRFRRFGHYARVLVDVDLSEDLPTNLWVERRGHGFRVDISYEKLPHFCAHCRTIGHLVANCRLYNGRQALANNKPKQQGHLKKKLEHKDNVPVVQEPQLTLLQKFKQTNPHVSTSDEEADGEDSSSNGDSSVEVVFEEKSPNPQALLTNDKPSSAGLENLEATPVDSAMLMPSPSAVGKEVVLYTREDGSSCKNGVREASPDRWSDLIASDEDKENRPNSGGIMHLGTDMVDKDGFTPMVSKNKKKKTNTDQKKGVLSAKTPNIVMEEQSNSITHIVGMSNLAPPSEDRQKAMDLIHELPTQNTNALLPTTSAPVAQAVENASTINGEIDKSCEAALAVTNLQQFNPIALRDCAMVVAAVKNFATGTRPARWSNREDNDTEEDMNDSLNEGNVMELTTDLTDGESFTPVMSKKTKRKLVLEQRMASLRSLPKRVRIKSKRFQ